MVPPYFQAYSCQKNGRGKRKKQITTKILHQQQTKKTTNISAIRRKLRDELRNHYLIMLFFNKKIVLSTPICKINQLIRIEDKKASRLHCGLLFSFLSKLSFCNKYNSCKFHDQFMLIRVKKLGRSEFSP